MAFHAVDEVPHPDNESADTPVVPVQAKPASRMGACSRKVVLIVVFSSAIVVAIILATLAAAGVLWGSPKCDDSDVGGTGEPV